jgi:hypothetical protein
VSPAEIEATPGDRATAVFRIHNREATRQTIQPALVFPDGWTLVTPLTPVDLAPDESTVRLVSLSVPPRAPVATHTLRFVADGPGAASPPFQQVDVRVRPVRALDLTLLEAPATEAAGSPYTARFALTSKANVPLTVRLDAASSRQWTAAATPSSVRLPPWATTTIEARVETASVNAPTRHRLTLRARTTGPDTLSATAQSVVEIIPVHGTRPDDASTYPLAVRLQSVGDATGSGQQVELQGRGALTTDGAHTMDLFVRTPTASTLSGYGRRDRYRATYTADDWALQAGDHVYRLTPLTEPGRLGLGAGGILDRGRWTVGAHALQTRYGGTGRQAAAHLGLQAHSRLHLTGTLLHNEAWYDGTFAGLQARLTPWTDATLTLEGGTRPAAPGEGSSYRMALEGEHAWGSYHVRHLHADPTVPVATRDVTQSSAHAVVRVAPALTLDGRYRSLDRGLSPLSLFSYTSEYGRLGLRAHGAWGALDWRGALYGVYDHTDRRTRQGLEGNGTLRWGAVGLRGGVAAGRTGFGAPAVRPYRSYDLHLSLRRSRLSLGGGVDYTVAPRRAGAAPKGRYALQFGTRADLTDRTRLSLQGRWSATDSPSMNGYRSLSGRLEHAFRFGHVLALDGQSTGFEETPFATTPWAEVPSYRLSYTVPVGLPVVQDRTGDRVTGRVVDAETGRGIADARVRLGDAERLTDAAGRFALSRPADGAAHLRLDRGSIGLDRVPLAAMPLSVADALPGAPVVVPVTRSATLTTRVVLYDHPTLRAALDGEAPVAVGGRAQVVVEMADAHGRRRLLTGADGTATFNDLRPGPWTLRLVNPSLPPGHTLVQDTYTVTLAPGAQDSLTVRIVPRPQAPTASSSPTRAPQPAPLRPLSAPRPSSAAPTADTTAAAPDADVRVHVVTHVEWLAQLSREYYGTLYCWPVIWKANRDGMADPDALTPGMTLDIPPASACTVTEPGPPIPAALRPAVQKQALLGR